MKIGLLVRSLERGGAERQLVMLARVLQAAGVEVVVIVFYGGGPFQKDLEDAAIPVRALGKTSRWDLASFGARFVRVLRDEAPDFLYGFVVTPNLLASAIRPLFPKLRVIWGVRSAHMDLSAYDWATRLLYPLEARLSELPDLIIVNSQAGRRHLEKRGFPMEKVRYVPNGIDVERYCPDPAGGTRLRAEWGYRDSDTLVGIVARPDPVKAHDVFLSAVKVLQSSPERARFICVGVDGPVQVKLGRQARALGISERLKIVGPRDDLSAVYSALDTHVMCSHSEGFPNVVAEAMACGTPCVVTDVGDAAEIVGETGHVATPGNSEALAQAIRTMLHRVVAHSDEVRRSARARIVERYSLASLASRTLAEIGRLPER